MMITEQKQKQHRIIVVDDDPDVCETLSDILELEGFTVATAGNGIQALELIHDNAFDLILLDVRMPVMDGIETLKRIRENIPVLMISAFGDDESIRNAMDNGARGYLRKPFEFAKLLAAIDDCMAS